MKVQNGTCSDVRVAYIGGGSHGWAWTFFKDLAREEKMSGIIDLYGGTERRDWNQII